MFGPNQYLLNYQNIIDSSPKDLGNMDTLQNGIIST